MKAKISFELSQAEIDHLLAHLEANGQESGEDYDKNTSLRLK